MEQQPIQFSEIRSGMRLWDNKDMKWQKVLRVYLWENIIAENPGRYYERKPKSIKEVSPT